jgi:hypothetical protein
MKRVLHSLHLFDLLGDNASLPMFKVNPDAGVEDHLLQC